MKPDYENKSLNDLIDEIERLKALTGKLEKANNWMFVRLNDLDSFDEYVKLKDEIESLKTKRDHSKDIYGPGNDNYGRDKPLIDLLKQNEDKFENIFVAGKDKMINIKEELSFSRHQENDMAINYLSSEAEHQLISMTEILGKKPSMIEQGVNALIHIIQNPELYPSIFPKQEVNNEPVTELKSAEEWFDNNFDCYTENLVAKPSEEPAMTKETFLKYANQRVSNDIREALIDFASRNDKYNTGKTRNVDIPAYFERCRKDHSVFVDDFLKEYTLPTNSQRLRD